MADKAPLVLDNGQLRQTAAGDIIVCPGIRDSALTAGRVVFVTTNGLLADSSLFTFNEATGVVSAPGGMVSGSQAGAAFVAAVGGTAGVANGMYVRAIGNGLAGRGVSLSFDGPSGGTYRSVATIAGVDTDANNGGYLVFSTADSTNTLQERLRINSSGDTVVANSVYVGTALAFPTIIEKQLSVNFDHGVANQKCDLFFQWRSRRQH